MSLFATSMAAVQTRKATQVQMELRIFANTMQPISRINKDSGEREDLPETCQAFCEILAVNKGLDLFEEGDSKEVLQIKMWPGCKEYAPEGTVDPIKEGLFGLIVTGTMNDYRVDNKDKQGVHINFVRQVNVSKLEWCHLSDEE